MINSQFAIAKEAALLGDFFLAKRIYIELVVADPNCNECYLGIGTVLRLEGKVDKALEYFEKAITMGHSSEDLYCELGICHQEKGLNNEAIHYYTRAISINNNSGRAYYLRGKVLEVCNQFLQSQIDIDFALCLNYHPIEKEIGYFLLNGTNFNEFFTSSTGGFISELVPGNSTRYFMVYKNTVSEAICGISDNGHNKFSVSWELLGDEYFFDSDYMILEGWGDQQSGGNVQFEGVKIKIEHNKFRDVLKGLQRLYPDVYTNRRYNQTDGLENYPELL